MCNKSCLASSVLMRDDDAIYGTSWILLICYVLFCGAFNADLYLFLYSLDTEAYVFT